jgi:hypothetical protein
MPFRAIMRESETYARMIQPMVLLEADKIQRLHLFGEDTWDLLHTIEGSFGVKFAEDELVQTKTIRELAVRIRKKLEHPLAEKCLSAVTFYKLRRTFITLFNIPRARITPETSLRELMAWNDRRRRWREIQDHLRFVLPELRWPLWLVALSVAVVGFAFTLPVVGWARLASFAGSASGLFTFLAAICVWVLLLKLLSPLARTFPRSCESFGDLVKLTLARNYARIASEYGVSNEQEVLQALRQLISAEQSIDLREVAPDTLFPEGLKIY